MTAAVLGLKVRDVRIPAIYVSIAAACVCSCWLYFAAHALHDADPSTFAVTQPQESIVTSGASKAEPQPYRPIYIDLPPQARLRMPEINQ